jgi:hypothetical protein
MADLSGFNLNVIIPFLGTPAVEAGVYAAATGIDLTEDYTPDNGPIRGVRITGSGNLDVTYVNGSRAIIPVVVAADDHITIKGELITTIHSSATTTCTGVYPLF